MPKTQKKFYLILSILLALTFITKASANLSLNTNNITSDGSLTLTNSSGILTLPTTLGTSGQFLQTDGAGVTSWATPAGGIGSELLTNKSLNILTDATSDIKYPSVKAVKDYADSLVVGLLDYRGGYNASSNSYPVIGGSGAGGAILKGDTYIISTAGTLNGTDIQVGDSITANLDNPGQTGTNWNTLNTNISYVPENAANKVTSISNLSTDIQYPSAKLLFDSLKTTTQPLCSATVTTNCVVNAGPAGNVVVGTTVLDPVNGRIAPANVNFVFEGDSTVCGWNNTACIPAQSWPVQAMATPWFAGRGTATNMAFQGDMTADITSQFAAQVHPLRPAATGKAAYLFVSAGINDIISTADDAPTIMGRLAAYWATATADGFVVVAATIMPAASVQGNPLREAVRMKLNSLIRQNAAWSYLLDFDNLLNDPNDTALFLAGGLHPTPAGYAAMGSYAGRLMAGNAPVNPGASLQASFAGLKMLPNYSSKVTLAAYGGGFSNAYITTDSATTGILFQPGAGSGFLSLLHPSGRWILGSTTDSGSGAVLQVNGKIQGSVTTVLGLGACNASVEGTIWAVTDATAPAYNLALTGGGTVHIPVYCDGTIWRSH